MIFHDFPWSQNLMKNSSTFKDFPADMKTILMTFAQFTGAIDAEDNGGISIHRLSPYIAYYLQS